MIYSIIFDHFKHIFDWIVLMNLLEVGILIVILILIYYNLLELNEVTVLDSSYSLIQY
jgi:hypothetical protein